MRPFIERILQEEEAEVVKVPHHAVKDAGGSGFKSSNFAIDGKFGEMPEWSIGVAC